MPQIAAQAQQPDSAESGMVEVSEVSADLPDGTVIDHQYARVDVFEARQFGIDGFTDQGSRFPILVNWHRDHDSHAGFGPSAKSSVFLL